MLEKQLKFKAEENVRVMKYDGKQNAPFLNKKAIVLKYELTSLSDIWCSVTQPFCRRTKQFLYGPFCEPIVYLIINLKI